MQYVIDKYGHRESNQAGEGHILWYGLALREHDLEMIKTRKSLVNRYPLMDVSSNDHSILILSCLALCKKERPLCDHQ